MPHSGLLPLPGVLDPHNPLVDEPTWTYPSTCAGGGGVARLRVWPTDQNGHLAIVTEKSMGVSITNAAEDIYTKLAAAHPGPLIVLEHWPAGDGAPYDRLDQVHAPQGAGPLWLAIWPVPSENPRFNAHEEWMHAFGTTLLTARRA